MMRFFLWALVFGILGGVLGGFLALGFGASVGVASGLLQGSQAGVCLTIENARAEGLFSEEQATALIGATIKQIQAQTADLPNHEETEWVADRESCAELLETLQPPPRTRTDPEG